MSNTHEHLYHPSLLFVDQLSGLLDFVMKLKQPISGVDPVELKAILDAQRGQEDQEKAESNRRTELDHAFAESTAQRHESFQRMLGTLRGYFRGDEGSLAVLDGLKRKQKRGEATKAQSKAERAQARVARAQDQLDKLQARLTKAAERLSKVQEAAANVAPPTPPEPTPKPTSDGK